MAANHPHWWVTIRLDACRTRDEVIQARSQYAAGWLYRQLHPGVEILQVRPVRYSFTSQED